jgi:hypothetical protein
MLNLMDSSCRWCCVQGQGQGNVEVDAEGIDLLGSANYSYCYAVKILRADQDILDGLQTLIAEIRLVCKSSSQATKKKAEPSEKIAGLLHICK